MASHPGPTRVIFEPAFMAGFFMGVRMAYAGDSVDGVLGWTTVPQGSIALSPGLPLRVCLVLQLWLYLGPGRCLAVGGGLLFYKCFFGSRFLGGRFCRGFLFGSSLLHRRFRHRFLAL